MEEQQVNFRKLSLTRADLEALVKQEYCLSDEAKIYIQYRKDSSIPFAPTVDVFDGFKIEDPSSREGTSKDSPVIGYKRITIDEHGIDAVLEAGNGIIQGMAGQLLELLKAYEAPNYVEMKMQDGEGQELVVTIQKGGAQTPADQIKLLKERVKELEEQIEDAHYDQLE